MNKAQLYSEIKKNKTELGNDIIDFQSLNNDSWEKTKHLISKNLKGIIWKAWIEPINFVRYEKKILYLATNSKLISNRAETQYYEIIFF